MTISKKNAVIILLLAALLVAHLVIGQSRTADVEPAPRQEKTRPHYLGTAVFSLPLSFETARLESTLVCISPGPISLVEIPAADYDRLTGGGRNPLVPEGQRHFMVKDLSDWFETTAQLFITDPETKQSQASIIIDSPGGALRFTTILAADGQGGYDSEFFERQVLAVYSSYVWGHSLLGLTALRSPVGGFTPPPGCDDYRAAALFQSPAGDIKLMAVNSELTDQSRFLQKLGLSPAAWADSPDLFGLAETGGSRRIQAGPRRVGGQNGRQSLSLRRGFENRDQEIFVAVWQADKPAEGQTRTFPTLVMIADGKKSSEALRAWRDLLNNGAVIGQDQ